MQAVKRSRGTDPGVVFVEKKQEDRTVILANEAQIE